MAKKAQKKKLRKKKSADGEISRSAERDKATRLEGAAFYKKAGEKFWKGHAIKLFKTWWGQPFFFCFKSFWEGGVNCPARTRDKSGGKPFSRKGFSPLLVPRSPLQIPQPLFLLAKKAQKKKLNKKKNADGEISRSAERDKATRLDGAAFSKRRAKSFEAIPP